MLQGSFSNPIITVITVHQMIGLQHNFIVNQDGNDYMANLHVKMIIDLVIALKLGCSNNI